MDNRIPCKNENCKGTILPAIAEKTGIAKKLKELEQVSDTNCISHFMRAFKSVFVLIRAYPEAEYNIALLKVFQKYIAQVEKLNNVGTARLRNDIKGTEGIGEELKADLISTLDVYTYKDDIKDLERLSKYLPVLNEFVYELLGQLQKKDFIRVRDLADATHNFPEFMMKDTWSAKEYWKIYIAPYRKHWDKNFLDNWKKDFQVGLRLGIGWTL